MGQELGFEGVIWVDPDLKAFRALGLLRGAGKALSLNMMPHLLRAWRGGHRQAGVQGDPWQLGGALVVNAQGLILFHQISSAAGDHVVLQEIFDVMNAPGRTTPS
jgi:hypothetical protein